MSVCQSPYLNLSRTLPRQREHVAHIVCRKHSPLENPLVLSFRRRPHPHLRRRFLLISNSCVPFRIKKQKEEHFFNAEGNNKKKERKTEKRRCGFHSSGLASFKSSHLARYSLSSYQEQELNHPIPSGRRFTNH